MKTKARYIYLIYTIDQLIYTIDLFLKPKWPAS